MNGKGYHTVMLTGDVASSANHIAQEVGIQGVRAELLPQDKLEVVQSLRSEHGSVMFVGDGINDAPVLTGADVGGAMGSGADSAIEAADVVYINSNLDSVWHSLSIAERTLSIAWQNIFFAIAVKIIVMVAGVFGFANMWVAVFASLTLSVFSTVNNISPPASMYAQLCSRRHCDIFPICSYTRYISLHNNYTEKRTWPLG